MIDEVILMAFGALRTQVGALQAQIDALERLAFESLPGPQVATPCLHAEDDLEDDGSTLGTLRQKCRRCGQTFEKVIDG